MLEVKVEALCLGQKPDAVLKCHVEKLCFELDGIVGDRHRGFSKAADGRDRGVVRGTPVRNWRQWSAVSIEELEIVAQRLGVDKIDPAWLGANLAFSGHAEFTKLPIGTRIWFPGGAVLSVEAENQPCLGPGKEIACHMPAVKAADFPKNALKLRGLVGVVFKAGAVELGDIARIEIKA